MNQKFRDLLHRYKVEAFKISHNKQVDEELTKEAQSFLKRALNEEFHYHFHQDPSPEQLEILQMVKNFAVEALLPPVIDRVMRRVVALEKQHALMVQLVDELLETLSDERQPARSD